MKITRVTSMPCKLLLSVLVVLSVSVCVAKPPASSVAKQVEQVNFEIYRAIMQNDRKVLERRIAQDAVFSGSGSIKCDSKSAAMSMLQKHKPTKGSVLDDDCTITPQQHTVVVVGTGKIEEDSGNLLPIAYMNVFVKRHGYWQLLASYTSVNVTSNNAHKQETGQQ